jgi:adenine/guanine phosphoribosyltransferase-like PRPP-binding protein
MTLATSYLGEALTRGGVYAAARRVRHLIKKNGIKFDAVVFTGYSGALVGPVVAAQTGKSMVIIRKEKENTHSAYPVEGEHDVRRFIIVDDFVAGGGTVERILKAMRERRPGSVCVAIVCYSTFNTNRRWDRGFTDFGREARRIPVYRPDRRVAANQTPYEEA